MHNGHVVNYVCSICGVVGSNIAVELSILDMWSVLCVSHMWVVGSNIAIIIRNVRTGHVVSGMRSTCEWLGLIW